MAIKGKAVSLAADDEMLSSVPSMTVCLYLRLPLSISIPVSGAIDVKVIGGQVYVGISSLENSAALTDYVKIDAM